jgi:hypothetical protein
LTAGSGDREYKTLLDMTGIPAPEMPTEWIARPRRRPLAVMVSALLVLVSASAGYLHANGASEAATAIPRTFVAVPVLAPVTTVPTSEWLSGKGAASALIRQYRGLNGQPSLGVRRSAHIRDSAAISKLVRLLNALPAFPREAYP